MSSRSVSVGTVAGGGGCAVIVVWLLMLLAVATVGGFAMQYDLATIIGAHPPFWACMIAGLFTAPLAIVVAIVVWIVTLCNVHVPFWHLAMMAQTVSAHFRGITNAN